MMKRYAILYVDGSMNVVGPMKRGKDSTRRTDDEQLQEARRWSDSDNKGEKPENWTKVVVVEIGEPQEIER